MSIIYFDNTHLLNSDALADGDDLIMPAILAVAGNYPDKGVTLTTAHFDKSIQNFTPTNLNYEHKRGFLDGKLGQLRNLWRDGDKLMGHIKTPKWLMHLWHSNGERGKLSAEWDLRTGDFAGLAWTGSPRISEAGLVASFTSALNAPGMFSQQSAGTAPSILFHGIPLHNDDVAALEKHWDLKKAYPDDKVRAKELQETVRCLEYTPQGKQIFNRLVGRGEKS